MKLRIALKNTMKLRKSLNLYKEDVSLYNGFEKLDQNASDEENVLTSSNSGSILPNRKDIRKKMPTSENKFEFNMCKRKGKEEQMGQQYSTNTNVITNAAISSSVTEVDIYSFSITNMKNTEKVLNHPQSSGQVNQKSPHL
uniref:Uncharacterized protein n=1 Tax=Glossina austeni TaxID=7395 RepID=A0A1A9VDC9_GLOAU